MIYFDAEKFSKAIKTKRIIEKNIEMRVAAQEIGISFSTLSRLERENLPDLLTYAKICNWLGVELKTFIKKESIK